MGQREYKGGTVWERKANVAKSGVYFQCRSHRDLQMGCVFVGVCSQFTLIFVGGELQKERLFMFSFHDF